MTRRRLSASALLAIVATVGLTVYVFRHAIVNFALTALGLRFLWTVMRHRLGMKGRPKSSWSSLGRTAALMYASWNSRFLKGTRLKASVPASAVTADDGDARFGTVPF